MKKYDFQKVIDWHREFAEALLKSDDINLMPHGHVTMIKYGGAEDAATKLLKISEWLARLEENLNAKEINADDSVSATTIFESTERKVI